MSKLRVDAYLENCQAWQKMISAETTPGGKAAMARQAFRIMTIDPPYDRNIILGSDAALQIPDGANPTEESLYPVLRYGELQSKGWLGRLFGFGLQDDLLLTWPVYHPSVLGPRLETDTAEMAEMEHPELHLPLDVPLQRPLHFSVGLINFAIAARC